jgi:hypothetical protein
MKPDKCVVGYIHISTCVQQEICLPFVQCTYLCYIHITSLITKAAYQKNYYNDKWINETYICSTHICTYVKECMCADRKCHIVKGKSIWAESEKFDLISRKMLGAMFQKTPFCLVLERDRVARWYIFKQIIPIWVNFGGP